MSENLSPEVKEAMVAGFSPDGRVLVHDPFCRFDRPVALDWNDCCNNGYKDLYPGSTRILVKMASKADGWLTIVCKDEIENEESDF